MANQLLLFDGDHNSVVHRGRQVAQRFGLGDGDHVVFARSENTPSVLQLDANPRQFLPEGDEVLHILVLRHTHIVALRTRA